MRITFKEEKSYYKVHLHVDILVCTIMCFLVLCLFVNKNQIITFQIRFVIHRKSNKHYHIGSICIKREGRNTSNSLKES